MKKLHVYLAGLCILLLVAGCEQAETFPTEAGSMSDEAAAPNILSQKSSDASQLDPAAARIVEMVDEVNAKLEAGGSELRLNYPWLFTVGVGVDPFGRLRTGSRWTNASVEYAFDRRDFTNQIAESELEATMVQSFETWNGVDRTYISVQRGADIQQGNPDMLDGTILQGPDGPVCVSPLDFFSDTLVEITAGGGLIIDPVTDILVGGWLGPEYFDICLNNPSILGVTWSLSGGDANGDGYADLVYVEQFYNEAFPWVTSGSQYLDFSDDAEIDLETVAAHENGHALGLGHFGGPVRNQPFKLRGNLKVFTPEAVMNGGYLGGEKRNLLPTDIAGLTTLYSGHVSTTQF